MVSKDIVQRDHYSGTPQWTAESKEMTIECRGDAPTGTTKYDYRVSLTAAEILHLVYLAVENACEDKASRAVGMGAFGVLRELLEGQRK